jgi:hypothetical protein
MELRDGDIYEQINSKLKFTLKQETPVTWSLSLDNPSKIIYPEVYMISLLEKNFRKVENE